jgi:hypothetical protein
MTRPWQLVAHLGILTPRRGIRDSDALNSETTMPATHTPPAGINDFDRGQNPQALYAAWDAWLSQHKGVLDPGAMARKRREEYRRRTPGVRGSRTDAFQTLRSFPMTRPLSFVVGSGCLLLLACEARAQAPPPDQVLQTLKKMAKADVERGVVGFTQPFEFKRGRQRNLCYYLPPLATSGPSVVEMVYRIELLLQNCGDDQLRAQIQQITPDLDWHLIGALGISENGRARPGNEARYSEEISNCYNIIDQGMNNFAKAKKWRKAQVYWSHEEYRTERQKKDLDQVFVDLYLVTVWTNPAGGIVQAAPLMDFKLAEAERRVPQWMTYVHGNRANMSGIYVYCVEHGGNKGKWYTCPPIREPGTVVFTK